MNYARTLNYNFASKALPTLKVAFRTAQEHKNACCRFLPCLAYAANHQRGISSFPPKEPLRLHIRRRLLRGWRTTVHRSDKITIVGTGKVGMAIAIACLSKNVSNNICLVDIKNEWKEAEKLELANGSNVLKHPKVTTCSNGDKTDNSRVIVLAVSERLQHGETEADLVKKNTNMFKEIVPKLAKLSPKAVFIVVTDPSDIMTYATLKLTKFPKERVIGAGCHLDTARFRYFIAERLDVAPNSVHGYIIGEHGKSCVPVWSSVNVGGVLLRTLNKFIGTAADKENWAEVHKKVIQSVYDLIKIKEYSSWAVGITMADVITAIIEGQKRVMCLAFNAKGIKCVEKDVCLSMPCVVGTEGIRSVINLNLTTIEEEQLRKSANVLSNNLLSLDI